MWVVVLVLGVFATLLGVIIASTGEASGTGYFLIVFGILLVLVSVYNVRKRRKDKKIAGERRREESEYLSMQMEAFERGELPVLTDTPLLLGAVETAHLALAAARNITKNKAVGRTGGGAGVSFRVAKGVSLRTGGGSSKTIFQDVTSSYRGQLYVTNQRVVFINSQNGFECKLKDISAVTNTGEGRVDIQTKNKTYSLLVAGDELFHKALQILR